MKLRTTYTVGLLTFALAVAPRLHAQQTWNNTGTGNWATSSNWTPSGVPSANGVTIANGGTVTLDSAVPDIATLITSGGSKMVVSSGASLSVTGVTNPFRIGNSGTNNTLTMTGGSLAITGGASQIGSATANSATVNFSGGTWNATGITTTLNTGATFNISGSASLTTNLVTAGIVNHRGGTVNITTANASVSGTYTLSGGSLQAMGTNRDLSIGSGGVFKIVGSASTFNLQRHVAGAGTLVFELDNSANHITTIQSNTFNMDRAGTLAANLAGGILLSNKNHFDLIQASSFSANDFSTKPTAGAGSLWNTTIANDVNGTRDAVRITLNSNLLQGTLDKIDAPTLTLGSNVSKGYINLDDFGDAIILNLSLGGGVNEANSLASFTAALTAANVTWSTSIVEGFDIALTLDGATAGKEYFAWDFSSVSGVETGYGVNAISAIPEPGAVTGIALGGSLLLLSLRKRRNSNS